MCTKSVSFKSLAATEIAQAGGVYAALAFGSLADAFAFEAVQHDLQASAKTESGVFAIRSIAQETVRPASRKVA